MKQMRKLYDPELYEVKGEKGNVIYSYGTDCDNKTNETTNDSIKTRYRFI